MMATAAAATPRRLSDLPDDVLRRILFFAPAREGATTAVLARRWRWLWRTCGAVNLDTRSFNRLEDEPRIQPQQQSYSKFSTKEREVFLRAAGEALAATAAAPLTRLSVVVAANSRINTTHLEDWSEHDLIGAVVNNPAARCLEELHVQVSYDLNNKFSLSFDGSLPPSKTLRVARIIYGALLTATPPPDTAAAFPRLAELHLERCTVPLAVLQRIVDAAPQLETLHLESCYMPKKDEEEEEEQEDAEEEEEEEAEKNCWLLVFPAVTALVFASCNYRSWDEVPLEIDAPRLQYFRYQGSVQHSDRLLLRRQMPAANLAQVDLDFIDAHNSCIARFQAHELFWRFIRNFSTAKVLKIQLHFPMDRVAVVADKGSQDELLGGLTFSLLVERLELQAQYDPGRGSTMVMLANLLHFCPVVRDLQLKLSKGCYLGKHSSIDKEVQADFNKSVDHFRKRISPMVSLGEEDGGNHEASYIPGLSDESFDCLQTYLRRVSLHFCMEEANCLGVQLAKFFAENAVVLEEMYIDDGSQKMREHMNNTSVGRSLANHSAKTRKFGGISILPR